MKHIFYLIQISTLLLVQNTLFPQQHAFNPKSTVEIVKDLKLFVVSIEQTDPVFDKMNNQIGYATDPKIVGSGMMVIKDTSTYAITNFHVIKPILTMNKGIAAGVNVENKKGWYDLILLQADSINDIAILKRIGTTTKDTIIQNFRPEQWAMVVSWLGGDSLIKEGVDVISLGFPMGLGSAVNRNKPIIRKGMIAQSISGENTFLVDGLNNHGNSGSPVFINHLGEKVKWIGMIREYKIDYTPIFVKDTIKNIIDTRYFPYNSGLTVCISASSIWKMLP